MSKPTLIVYLLTSNQEIKDQFDAQLIISASNILHSDPLYIINLNNYKGVLSLKKLRAYNADITFKLIKFDWLPLRINCNDDVNKTILHDLNGYYKLNKKEKYCLINQGSYSEFDVPKIQAKLIENNYNLLQKFKDHLSATAGMFYFNSPQNTKQLQSNLTQITQHFKEIELFEAQGLSSGSFYKEAFNRMDYGVSIISSNRLIVYTNMVRRQYFGEDIIGKNCFDVFTAGDCHEICNGCPMGQEQNISFSTDKSIRSESHKLKDKNGKVYCISETVSKIELVNAIDKKIETFGINVVRDKTAKVITSEFQKLIQKLDKYSDIIYALKFAVVGGTASDFKAKFSEKSKCKKEYESLMKKLSFTCNDKTEILNFGFGRMRYYRNHVNIFQENFESIPDPYEGDILQVYAAYSFKSDEPDTTIIWKYIDYKEAKDKIMNPLVFDESTGKLINTAPKLKISKINNGEKLFLDDINLNPEKDKWYDILLYANERPLGFLSVDWKGRENTSDDNEEKLQYLYQLANFSAQAIQRTIDYKELEITREISGIINNDYERLNDLYLQVSKFLCSKLQTLKCEVYSYRNDIFIRREFLYYHKFLTTDQSKALIKAKSGKDSPNEYIFGKHLLGNVFDILIKNFKAKKKSIYYKCINVFDYKLYDQYWEKIDNAKVSSAHNREIEEELVTQYAGSSEYNKLKNCIIAPLIYRDKISGVIKLTNNGFKGNLFFPIHEQRILYYVAKQLAIKINSFTLTDREKRINKVFENLSDLLTEAEKFEANILKDWYDDLDTLENKIEKKIIFGRNLVDLIGADVLYYYHFSNINNKYVQPKGQYRSFAVQSDVWTQIMAASTNPLDIVNSQKDYGNQSFILNKDQQIKFTEKIFDENNQQIICLPVFINNEPFSVLLLRKIENKFEDADYLLIKAIVKQITGILQSAAFKRKGQEIMQNLSHQIIAPLSGLDSRISQLIRNTLDKKSPEYFAFKDNDKKRFVLDLVKSQALLVRHVASNYKHFIEVEMDNVLEIKKDTHYLKSELIRIVAVFQPVAQAQGLNEIQVKGNDEHRVYTDKMILFHIVSSLIDNAIKYSDKGTSITVFLNEKDEETYTIDVVNYGILIMDYEKIFERNYRADNAIKRYQHGSGIGLFIVRKFVEALGGKCFVKASNKKEGNIIRLELPKTLK